MTPGDDVRAADPERDVVLPGQESAETLFDLATRAEELGYARLTTGEVTGWNVAALLAALAERTGRIGLSNDVFSPYGRSPALLGQTAVTLQALSGGRYRLGLGTSSPALAADWHGVAFDRPLRRLRETVEIVRQVQSGDPVDYDGEVFDLGGLSLAVEPPAEPAPVDVAALGPKAVELVGRFADGWVPQLFTPDGLADRMGDLERGADLGDRDDEALRVSPTVRCCALEDGDRARDAARNWLAFMVAVYGPYYRKSIARQGYEAVTDEIVERWEAGDREAAVEAVTDEVVEAFVAAGTPDEVRETVGRFEAVDGVDAVRVGFLGQMGREERQDTLAALAPGES